MPLQATRTLAAACVIGAAIGIAGVAQAQSYDVGQTVEASYGGPWMVCTVVKHNVKQTDYEVSCPGRPDTFRAADDANHIRPHDGAPLPVVRTAPSAAAPAPRGFVGGGPAETYHVGQIVEANYGGPWMVCTVVKHNVKQEDYEVRCPDRPDTFRAADDANHIRPHVGGLPPARANVAPRAVDRPAQQAAMPMPPMGPAPASSASNVLLGRWKLTEGTCNSLILEFSPHQSRDYNKASAGFAAYCGQRYVESYVRDNNKVYVIVPNVSHATVTIRDNNHIVPDGLLDCVYTRV